MGHKRYCLNTFEANVNGERIAFKAWTTDTYSGFCETVHCTTHGITDTKQSWCGRSWQRFDYESALKRAIKKLPTELQDGAYKQLIDHTHEEEVKKANAMFDSFKAIHDKCSDRQKEMLANSGIQMNSEEDVKRVESLMLLGQLMGI